jgi:hypothetical protein
MLPFSQVNHSALGGHPSVEEAGLAVADFLLLGFVLTIYEQGKSPKTVD